MLVPNSVRRSPCPNLQLVNPEIDGKNVQVIVISLNDRISLYPTCRSVSARKHNYHFGNLSTAFLLPQSGQDLVAAVNKESNSSAPVADQRRNLSPATE
ncbi:hypothetical protein RRG08_066320 [Elysia crispata]|uniref:Uncharacterized protein n=1 Tax=Elysia crispata TaxID=231223 RepID=A0AAE1E3W9_9GAST|nr:hypothetical protein RRG08_066320 [Elysia crispata]